MIPVGAASALALVACTKRLPHGDDGIYPLLGKHKPAACPACHVDWPPKALTHSCLVCHADEAPSGHYPGQECGPACHTTVG
ncbi:MAG: hypothetical protein ABMB14_14875, partial [Myxococcota bacterium]